MVLAVLRLGWLRWTTWLTAVTLVCAWEKRKIRVPPHTTETAQQQNNATPASDVSAKQETQCRAARTPSRGEFKASKYQTLRQRRRLFQPQVPGRNSSLEKTFAVRNAAQIPPRSEQSPTTAPCSAPSFRDGPPALQCLSLCHGMGRKPRRSHQRSPVVGSALPPPLPLALGRGPQRYSQKFGIETMTSRRSRSVSPSPRYWDSNTLVRSAGENWRCCRRRMNSAETSLRHDSQRIHQQSRERTRG